MHARGAFRMQLKKVSDSGIILATLISRYNNLSSSEPSIREAISMLESCFRFGGKLLVCGNGGSAADSEHIVGELMKSFRFKREVTKDFRRKYRCLFGEEAPSYLEGALPAISLVSHTALSTAFGNDEAPIGIFAQQVYGYGKPGDVFLGISTSGNSTNVVEAAKVAKTLDMRVLTLTGANESKLSKLSDVAIKVPEKETFKVQELHLPVYHALCAAVEASFFEGNEHA